MKSLVYKSSYLITGFVSFLFLMLSFYSFPRAGDSREIALSQAIGSWSRPAIPDNLKLSAGDFCQKWTGKALAEVDCRSAYDINTLTPVKSDQAAAAWQEGLASFAQQQTELESLVKHLETVRAQLPAVTQPLFGLQLRVDRWAERALQLRQQSNSIDRDQRLYSELFQLLLEQQGLSYNAASGSFKKINWHVVRATDQPSGLVDRANTLAAALSLAPWLMGVGALILLSLGWWRAGWMGWWLILGFLGLYWLSLLIAGDASVNYGQGSTFFSLNPLGNQFARQLMVGGITGFIIVTGLLLIPIFRLFVPFTMRHLVLTMGGFLLLIGLAYGLLGPAMGSEFLKLGTAVVAGLLMAAFGRSVHATAALSPEALAPLRLVKAWMGRKQSLEDPSNAIASMLSLPLIHFTLFCGAGIGAAALVFQDLGAALVTSIVAVSALFMVFGNRLAGAVLSLGVLLALLMSQTDKVQSRIALMVDPLSASVSDFARLLAFSNASSESRFDLGNIPWCSSSGSCIPLQALSDYMPVVLTSVLGQQGTFVFFMVYMLVLLGLSAWLMQKFLTLQGPTRALSMMAFFMLWGTAAQTMVTFLGNWRLIPLTGLGAPLLSIGLSSALVPVIAMTLTLVVKHQIRMGKP
jgi:cell division protein FtsW (lipid II flippase)